MKQVLITAFLAASLGGVLLAQQPSQPSSPAASQTQQPPAGTQPAPAVQPAAPTESASRIAAGSIIPARLTKTVDAKKVKKGDEIVATVPGDLKANNGQVLVPKDTKVIGHITEAQARSKEQKESQLGIAFSEMTMKDGQQVQLPMSIQAVVVPPNRQTAPGNEQTANAPSSSAGSTPGGGARGGAMGGNYPQQPQTAPSTQQPAPETSSSSATAPITENTKGVVGIPNLTLSTAPDASTGAVLTSEKNNVKLEDGTMLLLRVSPSGQQTQQAPQSPQQ